MTLDDPALYDALTRCELTTAQLAGDAKLGWLWLAVDPQGAEDLLISARDPGVAAQIARRMWGPTPARTPEVVQIRPAPARRRSA